MRRTIALCTALLVLPLAACSGGEVDSDVSERDRLEALGNSGVPGAQGVNGALEASDALEARTQAHDTIR